MRKILESVYENRETLDDLDNKVITEELIQILRLGITTTLLFDENDIEAIRQEYDGTLDDPILLKEKSNKIQKYRWGE